VPAGEQCVLRPDDKGKQGGIGKLGEEERENEM
jgi:hypothetical protein